MRNPLDLEDLPFEDFFWIHLVKDFLIKNLIIHFLLAKSNMIEDLLKRNILKYSSFQRFLLESLDKRFFDEESNHSIHFSKISSFFSLPFSLFIYHPFSSLFSRGETQRNSKKKRNKNKSEKIGRDFSQKPTPPHEANSMNPKS